MTGSSSERHMRDRDKVEIFAELWGAGGRGYDEERERGVAQRRFGAVIPHVHKLIEEMGESEGRKLRVLDFGCSDGQTASHILHGLEAKVAYYGSDLYLPDAALNRMFQQGFQVEVSGDSVEGIPRDWPTFDLVLALSCFQYISDPAEAFSALVSKLDAGGVVVAYFYDSSPMRQCTDTFLRERFGPKSIEDSDIGALSNSLEPLVELVEALRQAAASATITIRSAVPELGISAGTMPLQQFIVDYLIFAWAPQGASTERIKWALSEMFLTGDQFYLGTSDVDRMLRANALETIDVVSNPSGHLVVARKIG